MKKHAPLLYRELARIKKDRREKVSAYSRMKNVSIDYQVMEKAKDLRCVKAGFSWKDLGNWAVLAGLLRKDKNKNAVFGKAHLVDTRNSIIYNTEKSALGVIGMRNCVVARTKNGTLVANREDAEKVKELVSRLKE